jgi:hypothetical protein
MFGSAQTPGTFVEQSVDQDHAKLLEIMAMLITFSCPAYADIRMFGDVAARLLKIMGHSGTVPSALLAADVPAALARLKAGIAATAPEPPPETGWEDEPAVSLAYRAFPLIALLKAAARDECDVMWDSRPPSNRG